MKFKKKLYTEYIHYYNEYYSSRYAYINILKNYENCYAIYAVEKYKVQGYS